MTETTKNGGLFGFFKKKVSPSSPVSAAVVQDRKLITVEEMAPFLTAVLEEQSSVRIFLSMSSIIFYTHFAWELEEDGAGMITQSKAYLEDGQYILLAPLDPPIGNIKIRNATEIRAEFSSTTHLLECITTMQTTTPDRKICLTFPNAIRLKPERRDSIRLHVDRKMHSKASIVRPSGIVFEANFVNVSATGVAFASNGATPRIADHSKVEISIDYPNGNFSLDAIVLGSLVKDGETVFRSRFRISSQQEYSDVNKFVSYVQREFLQRRVYLTG